MRNHISKAGCAACLAIFCISQVAFTSLRSGHVGPVNADIKIEQLPMEFGDWKGHSTEGLGLTSREILQLDRYIRRIYKNSKGEEVFVYVGYWRKQSGEHQSAKHSPAICLPANGWRVSSAERETVPLGEHDELRVNRLVGEYEGRRQLFMYWFFSGERSYAEEWRALLNIGLESFLHGRSDGGIVEIATPVRGPAGAAELEPAGKAASDFINDLHPLLADLIRRG